jgi:filamentous hemagglutinin family protein
MAIKAEWNGVIFALLYLCSLSAPAIAQEAAITADGTTATDVTTPDGSNFDINGGDRAGSNLFHSFGNFGVPNGGSANFLNPVDIANIISRVTGGKTSTIEGLIKANGSANLFLINPAGIIFGPNASLNIGGSFLGSTADSLLFPEGEFSATNLQTPPLLTINAPIGLNLRDNPSPISNNSQTGLQVQSGKNVSLVGGDVSLDGGGITAPGGRIELGGLTAAGTVGINNDSSLSFPDSVARSNVSLTNGAFVDVIGEGGGFITVNANNLEILDGSGLLAGIGAGVGSIGAQAGDITLNATDKITIQGDANSGLSAIGNVVLPIAKGNAGDIFVNTKTLEGIGSFQISSLTFGEGDAGKVSITATEKVSFDALGISGSGIGSAVYLTAKGNADDIIINTPSLSLSNSALLATSTIGKGNAGNIQINATDSISISGGSNLQAASYGSGNAGNIIFDAENAAITFDNATATTLTSGTGKGGDISIKGRSLSLTNGAQLSSSTFGEGNAGNVTIAADGAVNLVGGDIFSNVENQAVGNGGKITITAGELSLKDRAQLQTLVRAADTEQNLAAGRGEAGNIDINVGGAVTLAGKEGEGGSAIFSRLGQGGEGKAGDINIKAGSLSLADEAVAIVSSTSGKGNAGNVTIAADGAVNLVGGNIFSNVGNQAVGDGGKIDITAKSLSLEGGAQLVAIVRGQDASIAGGKGNAGAINLNIADTVTISGQSQQGDRVFPSKVTSEIESGAEGRGGDINIKTRNLSLANDAVISSGNFGTGNGGNINLELQNTLKMRNNSTIEAQATGNNTAGNISINAPNGFVVAFPNQDNNIIATAEAGGGGQITINAKRIYGFDKERIQSLDRDNLFGNGENDINSTSADPKLSGNINLNIEQLDPAKERAKAPENVVEPDETVAQACDPENKLTEQNTFTIVGRGGMPPSPTEMLRSSFIQVSGGAEEQRSPDAEEQRGSDEEEQRGSDAEEQRGSDAEEQRGSDAEEQRNPDALSLDENKKTFSSDEVIPARGMMVNAQGQIVLTAYPTPNAGERTTPKSNYCSINREQATGSRQQSRPVVGEVLSISFRRTII